jgi:hypothetical protein
VPADLRSACQYSGAVTIIGENRGRHGATYFDCRQFTVLPNHVLELEGVIMDTSSRHNGAAIDSRLTYLEHVWFGGQIAWYIRSLAPDGA